MKSSNEGNMLVNRQRRVTFAGSLPLNRSNTKPDKRRMTLSSSNLDCLDEDERAASLVGSVASVDSKSKARSYPIWPEFNDNDINNEKWDGVKGKEKGKSPSFQFFDDPEGRLELPQSILVDSWKRPQDFLNGKQPFLVENENYFDLVSSNDHLCHSEVMRTIISQINSLWSMGNNNKMPSSSSFISKNPRSTPDLVDDVSWKPWHHIYSLCKTGKDHLAQYNPYGKYVVRLFWMGCWRKIVVDDQLPFDDKGCLLLPSTMVEHELWPMILAKALIKVAAIDYDTGNNTKEIGDFFVIHCLTGWLPELIPLKYDHAKKVWNLLKKILPEWKLPEDKPPVAEGDQLAPSVASATSSKKLRNESGAQKLDHQGSSAHHKEKGSGKEGKTGKDSVKKKEDKEKSKSSPHSARPISAAHSASGNKVLSEEPPSAIPENPEVVVFATFNPISNTPAPMSIIKEMADASEKLRTVGLSHLQPHPVRIGQTRSCPLIPPTPVPEIPQWKLFRPMKKRVTPLDQLQCEPAAPKPDQWLEISSPYIGHSVSPLTVDLTPLRPRSRISINAPLNENEDENEATSKSKEKGKSPNNTKSPDVNINKSRGNSSSTHSPLSSVKDGETVSSHNNLDVGLQPEEAEGDEIALKQNANLIKSTWIDYEDFWKSFKSLVVFHKTTTYPHLGSAVEFKQTAVPATAAPAANKKGSANVKENTSTTNIKPSVSPVTPKSYEGFPAEERNPSFLFIDNLEESEIVINYSVLPKWAGFEEKRISDRESVAGASEIVSTKADGANVISSGLLVAELYSWKTVATGQPVLRIRTTGTRAACLTLPPGRHVLRFIFNSPLGHHIQICSSTKFVYGDEDAVMVPLQEESCRFVKVANGIMESLIGCINNLGDREEYKKAMISLNKAHMSFKPKTKVDMLKHYKVWNGAFYRLMQNLMAENRQPAFEFSVRALMFGGHFDCGTKDNGNKGQQDVPENWVSRKPTVTEDTAAHCIQKNWRGTYVRKINRAVNVRESSEHLAVKEIMTNALATIQSNKQNYANQLLRYMLKDDPSLLFKYSLDTDEWNKICYVDYQGTFPDQNPKTWFVVLREVFYVEEDRLCVPKLYGAIPTCRLRIINNDNGEEIKTVFQKVTPHVYKKNQRGYTFVAEARTLDLPLPSGRWRMRLIGSNNSPPAPPSGQINAQFTVKEIRDYYIPNNQNILLRYHVKTTLNHIASIQLETSKPDVYIKLQILDNDEEVISTKGKGHCVIPAFCFLTNNKQDGDRTSSRLSNQEKPPVLQGSKQSIQGNSGKKRNSSAKSVKEGKNSPKSKGLVDLKPLDDPALASDEGTILMHNYTIQVIVEQKSWPLSESQWAFVQKLKDLESEELKAFSAHKDRIGSAANKGNERQSGGGAKVGTADKSKKGKGGEKGKDKKSHDKDAMSRPASQNVYDGSKAFWTLRFVSDIDKADEVEIKKDMQRQDEIRAMKQAWEAADSGRAIKAMQSRFSYLNKNKVGSTDKENEEETKAEELVSITPEPDDEILTWNPPSHPSKKDNVKKFDVTPFLRPLNQSNVKAKFIEPSILAIMEENEQKEKREAYAEKREKSLVFQEENRHYRLALKEQQLEICQNLQYALDRARAELLQPRDIYRKSLLEEKRLHDEEKEAQDLVTSEPVSPDPKGKKSAGKKKK